jgi:hypothetical protein
MQKVFLLNAVNAITEAPTERIQAAGFEPVTGGEASAYLLIGGPGNDLYHALLHPCRCPKCSYHEVQVIQAHIEGRGLVALRPALLGPDGFDVVLEDGTRPENGSTEDEIVRCPSCTHTGSLTDFGFYLANTPGIGVIHVEIVGGNLRAPATWASLEEAQADCGYHEITVKEIHTVTVRVPLSDAKTVKDAVGVVLAGGGNYQDDGEYVRTIPPDESTWWECDPRTGAPLREIKYP